MYGYVRKWHVRMLCDETDGVVYAQTVDILGERHIHVNVDNLVDISAVCVQILRNIYDSQVWAQEQLLIIHEFHNTLL